MTPREGREAMTPREVYAIRWRYYDGSGGATVQVYESISDAERQRDFLKEHAQDKEWHVDSVPFIEAKT